MADRLKGKRIIITGAATGIGRAAVRSFAREGARIVIADINESGSIKVKDEIGEACHVIRCDVSDEQEVKAMIESAVSWLGGIDVLCNNAALMISGAVTEYDVVDWDRVMAVNVRAHFLTCKHALAHMRDAGGGSIINTSSVAGQRGGPGATAYSCSKGAVIAFSKALASEVARDNIRVNTICPGWVDTPFNDPIIAFMGGREVQHDLIESTVPMRRQGTPEEIAPLFVYLASDESSYMTAKTIGIDGGAYS